MSVATAAATRARLPERLRALVLTVADHMTPMPDDHEIGHRLADAVAELSRGSIERDLLAALGPT
jgi:hypothetical protein